MLMERVKRFLPLLAAFLAGGAVFVTTGVGAGPTECDWKFSEDYFVEHVGTGGAATADLALRDLPQLNHTINVPNEAVTQQDGPNRFARQGTTPEGDVGYFLYIDGIKRVQVNISQGGDRTYYVDSFSTCLGV